MNKKDIVSRLLSVRRNNDPRGYYKATFVKWGKEFDIYFNSPVTFDALNSAKYALYTGDKISSYDFHYVKWLFASITPYK